MKSGFAVRTRVPSPNVLWYMRQLLHGAKTQNTQSQKKFWINACRIDIHETQRPTTSECPCRLKFRYRPIYRPLFSFTIPSCRFERCTEHCTLHRKYVHTVHSGESLMTVSMHQKSCIPHQVSADDCLNSPKATPIGTSKFGALRSKPKVKIPSEATSTPPLASALSPLKRQLRRSRQALFGIPSDNRWMRTCIWLIKQRGLKRGEIYWNIARLLGRDLEDLKRVAKVLMQEYNKAGQYLDTLRLFRWYEDAEEIERRRKMSGRDALERVNVWKYVSTMKDRAQRSLKLHGSRMKIYSPEEEENSIKHELVREMIREIWDLEADTEQKSDSQQKRPKSGSRPKYPDDKQEDIEEYLEKLRVTLLQFRKMLPPMYSSLVSKSNDIEAAIESWMHYGPPLAKHRGRGGVDVRALNFALAALIALFDPENAINLYNQYLPIVPFTPLTWEYVIQAHVHAGRLKQAAGLVRFAKHRGQLLTSKTYALVLHAIRTNGGSWDKMVRYFKWLGGLSKNRVPQLYHIMIQMAIELGMRDEADKMLHRMLEVGLKHTRRTFEDLLTAFAKVGDWERLKETIAIMDSKGFQIRTLTFNTMLNATAEAGDLTATEKLYLAAIDRGVKPDVATYNIMIKACVYARGVDESFFYWLSEMTKAGIRPDKYTFNTLFHDLRKNYTASATLLRRIYDRVLTVQSRVRRNSLILDNMTKLMLLRSMHNQTSMFPATYSEIRWTESIVDDRDFLALRMSSAIEAGKPEIALRIWKSFFSRGRLPTLQLILMAFRASIIFHDPTCTMQDILNNAKERGFNIPEVILSVMYFTTRQRLLSQTGDSLAEGNPESADALNIVATGSAKLSIVLQRIEEAYQFLEKHKIPITHHVTIHYSNRLIDAGKHLVAIHVLHQVAKTKWGQGLESDPFTLTVLLKAYIKSGDLGGIKWVVDRIIASRVRPTIGTYKMLQSYSKFFKRKDSNKRQYLYQLYLQCKLFEAKLDNEAKVRAEFLVQFAKRALGNKRRSSRNRPLNLWPENKTSATGPLIAAEAYIAHWEQDSDVQFPSPPHSCASEIGKGINRPL